MNAQRLTFAAFAAVCLFTNSLHATTAWQLFEPEGGGFSVLMPGEPSLEQKQGQTNDGVKYVVSTFYYSTPDESQVYKTRVVIYEDSIDVKDAVKSVPHSLPEGSKLLFSKNENMNGHPGKMLVFIDGKRVFVKKVFVSDTRIFEIVYSSSNVLKGVLTAAPFLDSYRITE